VIVEPLHLAPIASIFSYTSTYIMRSGHAWVCVASQKTTVDSHVKPFDPQRYESLHIDADPLPPDAADLNFAKLPSEREPLWWEHLLRQNQASHAILAQVGAAIKASAGPFEGLDVAHIPLAGHSGTGFLLTHYIREGHDVLRLPDGSSVYDG
jgi:Alpha/beta hydrolase domain